MPVLSGNVSTFTARTGFDNNGRNTLVLQDESFGESRMDRSNCSGLLSLVRSAETSELTVEEAVTNLLRVFTGQHAPEAETCQVRATDWDWLRARLGMHSFSTSREAFASVGVSLTADIVIVVAGVDQLRGAAAIKIVSVGRQGLGGMERIIRVHLSPPVTADGNGRW